MINAALRTTGGNATGVETGTEILPDEAKLEALYDQKTESINSKENQTGRSLSFATISFHSRIVNNQRRS